MVRLGKAAVAAAVLTSVGALAGAASANTVSVSVRATLAKSCSQAALGGTSENRALSDCTRALTDEVLNTRDRAATYVNRGVIYMLRGDYRSALTDFDQAVGLNAGLGEALVDRGIARIALGSVPEGITDIDRGLALGLSTPEQAYYHRALAREQLNDARGAYLDYRRAAELKPDWATPRREMARFTVTRNR
jgi:tetratricopeptide (TPR) repeat protein